MLSTSNQGRAHDHLSRFRNVLDPRSQEAIVHTGRHFLHSSRSKQHSGSCAASHRSSSHGSSRRGICHDREGVLRKTSRKLFRRAEQWCCTRHPGQGELGSSYRKYAFPGRPCLDVRDPAISPTFGNMLPNDLEFMSTIFPVHGVEVWWSKMWKRGLSEDKNPHYKL